MQKKKSLQHLRRTRRRNYYTAKRSPAERVLRWALLLTLTSTFLICTGKLIAYLSDYVASRNASTALKEAYYTQGEPPGETALSTGLPPPDTLAPEPAAMPTATIANPVTGAPATATSLPIIQYPDNPYGIISKRFESIRGYNSDIIGWLTIPDLLDEAVVQRDNQYYLKRDYRGDNNVNGAIFLEESCSLSTRPYTLILYGHNMKTGAMFGCLRNYENTTFYHNNPFISFDTVYEDGRYVIFSVATVSIISTDWNYLDLVELASSFTASRQDALKQLRVLSEYNSTMDVEVDDQLLLLITCKENDNERRVIAARRVRAGEDEAELRQLVRECVKKQ